MSQLSLSVWLPEQPGLSQTTPLVQSHILDYFLFDLYTVLLPVVLMFFIVSCCVYVVFTGVKGTGTTSNHTIVVEKTLGIEAAR